MLLQVGLHDMFFQVQQWWLEGAVVEVARCFIFCCDFKMTCRFHGSWSSITLWCGLILSWTWARRRRGSVGDNSDFTKLLHRQWVVAWSRAGFHWRCVAYVYEK